jgi:hypothetical protein
VGFRPIAFRSDLWLKGVSGQLFRPGKSTAMSDAQSVLALVFGDQPTTPDYKSVALALAEECRAEVPQIATVMGKAHGNDGKWA